MFEDDDYKIVGTDKVWNKKDEPWPLPGDLKVESVSATNLKEVVVTFSKEVDVETAEVASNYTFTGGLTVASANADGKTVVLTLDGKADQQGTYELTVDGVKGLEKQSKKLNSLTPPLPLLHLFRLWDRNK
nr:Ig-like domain-containing protein [Brevibacillus borstelensis]